MVSMEKAVTAHLDRGGFRFEVLVDPEAAQRIREGKALEVMEDLAADQIFKDASKGDRAADENIKKVFGTVEVGPVAAVIVKEGEIQLTTAQRKEMTDRKRKAIISEIARNAINPQTKTPHPAARIEMAMDEARVKVDPFKPVEEQVKVVLEALRPLLPIRFEKVNMAVRLKGEDYAKCIGDIKNFGTLKREEWQSNGMWIGVVEMPAGLQTDFMEKMNEKTRGSVEVRILK
ncbi:MAG: ribosome assembly factor SBDS [Euryarchaeota archaeon]|nr:ribosome assembly factor SBDS [Euryarchaeota archaeon]